MVLEADGGALAGALAKGSIIVDMSSSEPEGTRELGAELEKRGITLIDSYHCSRYNTNTGRLTPAMFDAVLARCRALIDTE